VNTKTTGSVILVLPKEEYEALRKIVITLAGRIQAYERGKLKNKKR